MVNLEYGDKILAHYQALLPVVVKISKRRDAVSQHE